MKYIAINIMIAELKQSTEPVLIRYIKSSGTGRGSVQTGLFMYGTGTREHFNRPTTGVSGKKPGNWKYQGLLPVIDTDKGEIRTLKISHIIGYKDYIVKH
jgi:hypothetical protein